MNLDHVLYDLGELDLGIILEDEPMYKHTTLKVGGPARYFVYVKDVEALKKAVKYCQNKHIKYMIVGNGSDLLFSDKEYEGVVLSLLKGFNAYRREGNRIIAQAGVLMIPLAYYAAKEGLSGFEFMSGIPGSIGGGVYMNAGAYKYCFADVVESVLVMDETGEIFELKNEQLHFDYRHSIFQEHPSWVVLEVVFKMNEKNPQEIMNVMEKRKERRTQTQPWNMPSAGSVFRNPQGKSAWEYIDACGLRGHEIGGAQVSLKHSNFIVNNGYASAKDILDLILFVQKSVFNEFLVELKREVILVNWE